MAIRRAVRSNVDDGKRPDCVEEVRVRDGLIAESGALLPFDMAVGPSAATGALSARWGRDAKWQELELGYEGRLKSVSAGVADPMGIAALFIRPDGIVA